jgi:aryl-alcohol dehydrogenase-like predicted oxidoreductase
VVKAGKARYLGASSMWAWQFAKMQYTATLGGWTRFVSMQNQYSLLMREEEREMFGLLADQGVGSIPYSPVAKGRLTRPWGERTARMDVDPVGKRFDIDADAPIVDAVQQVAEERGVPMAQVALAWVLRNPVVSAPILGPTKPHHLSDAVAALELRLTDEEVARLEAPYAPHLPTGF